MPYGMGLFLRTLILAGAVFASMTAVAQNAGPAGQPNIIAPRSSTGIAALVNGVIISNYDVDQRTALFLATSGVRPTAEDLPKIRAQVLRSLEDELIQMQEANRHRIGVTKGEVDKALQSIAADNKTTVAQIVNTIGQAGVSATTFAQQVGAQLIWQRLVTARYGTDILIGDQDVDEAMDRLKQGADKPQFLLSEIYIGVDRSEDEISARASTEQFVQQIKQGASFQIVAGQFSQSPSAADGGDIGWVPQGQLAEELDRALFELKPGQIAGPIRAEGGYHVLLLRDRREPAGTQIAADPHCCGHRSQRASAARQVPHSAAGGCRCHAEGSRDDARDQCREPGAHLRRSSGHREPASRHGVPAARQHGPDEPEPGIAQRADQHGPRRGGETVLFAGRAGADRALRRRAARSSARLNCPRARSFGSNSSRRECRSTPRAICKS